MDNDQNGAEKQQEQVETRLASLESLLHNFAGGLEICDDSVGFPISYINDGFTRLTGYTSDQLADELANCHENLIFRADVQRTQESLRWQLSEKRSYTLEYRLRRRDGQTLWVLDSGTLFSLENGGGVMHRALIDITEQKRTEQRLRDNNKRYEIGMEFSDVTIFDYDVRTKRMEHHWRDVVDYQTPHILDNAVETMIGNGVVQPESVESFRALYRKIEQGEPTADAIIHAFDAHGNETVLEIKLTSIFENGCKIPTRAIGVKKDVTKAMLLQREREYGNTLTANRLMTYEANVTKDKVLSYNELWAHTLNIQAFGSYSALLAEAIDHAVYEDDREMFLQEGSARAIVAAFEDGRQLIAIEYRRTVGDTDLHWYENTINIIKEEISGDIIARCYITCIDERKSKEIHVLEERKHYEAMISKSAIVYEVDVTNNRFLSGLENWNKLFGIEITNNYDEMLLAMVDTAIHPTDRAAFLTAHLRKNILEAYERGKLEVVCEYRRQDETSAFVWVRCTTHLFKDLHTGNIKGSAYVEKIDKEKRRELALIYKAQHDPLTGFYNKSAIEEHIEEFFSTPLARANRHVFFIMDIDRFKQINDNFGHAFGDAVLSQFAVKLGALFHKDDLLGRIGGDEFVVLMKNVQDDQHAINKARKICESMVETYTQSGVDYLLSLSVGIAYYTEHGKDYETLYRNSDTALYSSKEHGRNRFTIYRKDMARGETEVREIDCNRVMEAKKFEDSISDYVFRILYESPDKAAAIQSVLALVGKHYNVSRAYVFEDSLDGAYTTNTFEWCDDDAASCIVRLQMVPCNEDYRQRFNRDGILYVPDIWKESAEMRMGLEWQGIRSMLQFSIVREEKFVGFVGFDQYEFLRIPSARELSDMRSIANMIGMFITEMRSSQESKRARDVVLSIVNGLSTYAYVCDPQTYNVLFMNTRVEELFPEATVGRKCYEMFWNRTEPCEGCSMRVLAQYNMKMTLEQENGKRCTRVQETASYIEWLDGGRVCLIEVADIGEMKSPAAEPALPAL